MEKNKNLQHVQVPNNMTKDLEVKPKDLLVYACIKKYMNKKTKEAFPSLETISELSGLSIPTIRKSINILKKYNYLTVRKEGRKNVYKFNPYIKFEPFSYEFLEKKDLGPTTKGVLLGAQQKMFKDNGFGKISLSDSELAKHLNISTKTLYRVNRELVSKGYLDLIKLNVKDPETGLFINEKLYHLNELEQAIVFTLQNHENRLDKNEQDIKDLKQQMDIVLRENRELKKRIDSDITEIII